MGPAIKARTRPATSPDDAVRRARMVLLLSAGITVLLYLLPFGEVLARPLIYLSTLVHELGHGMAAILSGGEFDRLEMWSDASGTAWSRSSSEMQRAFISAGGLVGPAIAAALGFALARGRTSARLALIAIAAFLLWAIVFKIRSAFGVVVAGVVVAACLGVALPQTLRDHSQLLLGFLSVQLALSVFSRGDYLFTAQADTARGVGPSDVENMAAVLGGPYWLWGVLCGAVSILALLLGGWAMLRGARKNSTPRPVPSAL